MLDLSMLTISLGLKKDDLADCLLQAMAYHNLPNPI